MSMFCYQCQEAAKGIGCTGAIGVCGVSEEVINLQDVFVYTLKGVSYFAEKARAKGVENKEVNSFITDGLFMTITNVNFDPDVFVAKIKKALDLRETMKEAAKTAGAEFETELHDSVIWKGESKDDFIRKASEIGNKIDAPNEDIRSLRALVLYGIKGIAAYAEHANNLSVATSDVDAFMQKALVSITDDSMTADELVGLVMETGKYGVDVMALLDKANTSAYGNPEITKVSTGVRNNPAILISGHDLKDLEELLEQTKGTGVDV